MNTYKKIANKTHNFQMSSKDNPHGSRCFVASKRLANRIAKKKEARNEFRIACE